jgi:hypothetical protein
MTPILATLNLNNQSYNLYLINNSYYISDISNNPIDLNSSLGLELLNICKRHEPILKN